MRAFIAIELPQDLKNYLNKTTASLKASAPNVKWVEPENIHLTLKFLGEIDEITKDALIKIIDGLAKEKTAFIGRITSAGTFPDKNSPRVIWLGIDKGEKEITAIAQELETRTGELSIQKEDKKFSSHITIGRVKTEINRIKFKEEIEKITKGLSNNPQEFWVRKITLFQSTLTPKGPHYQPLYETSLNAT